MTKTTHPRTIFLTGATGLVGSYLLKVLLQNGHKVYCLVRSKADKTARQRLVDILNFWDKKTIRKHSRQLVVIEGDIINKNLGLSKKDAQKLNQEIEEIFHSAASINFNIPLDDIRKINVAGTQNILDFALFCKRLNRINHLSTAFVCGDYNRIFKETDLAVGQQFNSTYERSKFEAEKLVHSYRKKGIWIDIFRPALIVGESTTGKTPQFKHAYQFLQICTMGIFDALPLRKVRLNLVPVDFVSNFIYRISQDSVGRNRTYHVFPKHPIAAEKIINTAAKIIGFKKPEFIDLSAFNFDSLTPTQKIILRNNFLSVNTKAQLKGSNTREINACYSLVPIFSFAKQKGVFK